MRRMGTGAVLACAALAMAGTAWTAGRDFAATESAAGGGSAAGSPATPQTGPTGRVLTANGQPAAGALVTAHLPNGRTETVYADEAGAFSLPGLASPAMRVVAWLPGAGAAAHERTASAGPSAPSGSLDLALSATDPAQPPGSAWLAGLPVAEETRRFILDCTGCHVTDGSRVRKNGEPRSLEQWAEAVDVMRANFGQASSFPIISAWADAETLAPWAHAHLSGMTPERPRLRGPRASAGGGGDPSRVVLTEYAVPVPQDLPHDLMVAEDGTVWITGMFTHQMYTLDPASGAFGTVPIPVQGANPRALDIDAQGRIWVVLGGPGQVAIHDPSDGSWESHDVGMYAHSVRVDAGGRGWVNGHFTYEPELIASVDGRTGAVERHSIPEAAHGSDAPGESTIPYGLRVDGDGVVWATQLRGGNLIRFDPATRESRQWPMPSPHAGPRRPDVAPDGSIWIPLYSANQIVRFDPATESFETWDFPVTSALPYVLRIDQSNGTVWIGTGHGDVVASFDPAREAFTVYPLPTRGALIRHLDVDEARGEVWFAYGASPGIPGKVLRLKVG